jgi:cyanophycin synthetase
VEGWILEANPSPGLRPHWIANPDQDVATPLARLAFPEGAPARIPTAGVTGSVGKTTTCQMIAHIARLAGRTAGLATTQGVWSGGFRVARGDHAGVRGVIPVLSDRANDMAIFEFARGGLLRGGMGIDGVDVAAVLNVHDNHVGLDGISSREDLARVKSLPVRNARKWVFLNAEDPLALGMRGHVTTARLGLVGLDSTHPALAEHRRGGHCIVTLEEGEEGGTITLVDANECILELPLCRIPAGRGGRSRAIAANALFAAGIAHALGLPADAIGNGLSSFTSDVDQNPGRHNWINDLPFGVVLHWADGSTALGELMASLDQEPASGRRQLFLTCPGNRSDEWIRDLGKTAAGRFDRYCCADMRDLRGRAPGEVPALLAEGLRGGGVAEDLIASPEASEGAIIAVLKTMQEGEMLVIVTYETETALSQIAQYKRSAAGSLQTG